MFDALAAAGVGFLLGLRHATDADHVVAVTAIVARERALRRAAWIGVLWGVGHSVTLFVLGGILIAFRLTMPPRLGLALELGVAIMLVALGFLTLRAPGAAGDAPASPALDARRPLLVGTVHGLAGSAAVALVVLTTIRDTAWALAYLAVFGLGTVAGMLLVTLLVAAPALVAADRVRHAQRAIRLAAGALSVVVGLLLAREIVVEGRLFGAAPVWTPH
jgi:high-affinity nickel-transport protein